MWEHNKQINFTNFPEKIQKKAKKKYYKLAMINNYRGNSIKRKVVKSDF